MASNNVPFDNVTALNSGHGESNKTEKALTLIGYALNNKSYSFLKMKLLSWDDNETITFYNPSMMFFTFSSQLFDS